MNNSLNALTQFFTGDKPGSGPGTPSRPSKSQAPDVPVILNSTANLDGFDDLMPLYPPSKCSPKYLVIQCSCGRRVVPSSCMSLDCEFCAGHVGKRRADNVLRRLLGETLYQSKKHRNKVILYTIFTIPPPLREKYMDKKRWQTIRKKAWQILKKHFGAKFGVEASHPQGDKDPRVFAPHLNFLWCQEPGRRPFLAVQLLRKLWGTVLGVQTVDVHSQYSPRFNQIIHWVKYVTRTFPGTHKWTGGMRWYGKYPKARPIEHCRCADCNSRFQVIGFLDAQTVDDYWERGILIGRDPPWYRDADITPFKRRSV